MHSDLKPENILMSDDLKSVKLCDFGVSRKVERTRKTDKSPLGTVRFMPPEPLDHTRSKKSDVWALGCVILQFITGKFPYHELNSEMAIMF